MFRCLRLSPGTDHLASANCRLKAATHDPFDGARRVAYKYLSGSIGRCRKGALARGSREPGQALTGAAISDTSLVRGPLFGSGMGAQRESSGGAGIEQKLAKIAKKTVGTRNFPPSWRPLRPSVPILVPTLCVNEPSLSCNLCISWFPPGEAWRQLRIRTRKNLANMSLSLAVIGRRILASLSARARSRKRWPTPSPPIAWATPIFLRAPAASARLRRLASLPRRSTA